MAAKKDQIQAEFAKYDKDGNGLVSVEEAHEVLKQKLGFDSIEKTKKFLNACDKNKDGMLSYEEFTDFFVKVQSRVAELHTAFHEFDADGSGFITIDEAREAMKRQHLEGEDIEALVCMYDTNGDGRLDYEEFSKFWNAS